MLRKFYKLMAMTIVAMGITPTNAQQICSHQIIATSPDRRLQDNGDGTITDLSTGLIWKQCAEGLSGAECSEGDDESFTWKDALAIAELSEFAGSSDWRLPNKNELISLVEFSCADPAINLRYFPNTPSSSFWTSSPKFTSSESAWRISFRDGSVKGREINSAARVRLVRTP